jgi:cytochrome c oxidase cbb3-type subunit 3
MGLHAVHNRLYARLAAALLISVLPSCEREEREVRVPTAAANASRLAYLTELRAGLTTPPSASTMPSSPATQAHGIDPFTTDRAHYDQNAFAMSEGKRLYEWMNCAGCHAHGGGDKGPPLMDEDWLYGDAPHEIFASIVGGRPNGMPAYRGRIPDYQVWQITAYVRSLSGLARKDASPGRNDNMQSNPAEHSMEPFKHKQAQHPATTPQ